MKTKQPRTIEQALANAERIRSELPHLIQPSNTDYDMVILADEINRLRKADNTTQNKNKTNAWMLRHL